MFVYWRGPSKCKVNVTQVLLRSLDIANENTVHISCESKTWSRKIRVFWKSSKYKLMNTKKDCPSRAKHGRNQILFTVFYCDNAVNISAYLYLEDFPGWRQQRVLGSTPWNIKAWSISFQTRFAVWESNIKTSCCEKKVTGNNWARPWK